MLNCENKANTILESRTAETASKHTGTVKKMILIFISCLMVLTLVAPTMVLSLIHISEPTRPLF